MINQKSKFKIFYQCNKELIDNTSTIYNYYF